MKTNRQYLEQAAKAAIELKKRAKVKANAEELFDPWTEINRPINLEFLSNLYLRVFDGAILAKDFGTAHKATESLERLHFGKDQSKLVNTNRKAKS
jgi:hypothetical protein